MSQVVLSLFFFFKHISKQSGPRSWRESMTEQSQIPPGSKAHVCHLLSLTDSLKMGSFNTLVNTCIVWVLLSLHAWKQSYPTIVEGPVGNVSLDPLGGSRFATPDNWFCASEADSLIILPLVFFLCHSKYCSIIPVLFPLPSEPAGQIASFQTPSSCSPLIGGDYITLGFHVSEFKMVYQEDAQCYGGQLSPSECLIVHCPH